jgi:segregation and condensation protein B
MSNGNLENIVLALLFAADEPLSLRKMSSVLGDEQTSDIRKAVETWQKRFDDESWSVVLEKVAGGFQLSSRPQYAPYIARLYSGRRKLRLSKAALETLAIIAYKQPITRAEIEAIRGVGCGSVVANLLERSLVRITGKAKVLGAPFLYGTTQEFLEYLGLNSLKDLPSLEELEALLEREEAANADERAGVAAQDGQPAGETADAPSQQDGLEADVEMSDLETAAAGSARIGPDVDEPHHRPLGETEEDPPVPGVPGPPRSDDNRLAQSEDEPIPGGDEDVDPEEDPSHDPKE